MEVADLHGGLAQGLRRLVVHVHDGLGDGGLADAEVLHAHAVELLGVGAQGLVSALAHALDDGGRRRQRGGVERAGALQMLVRENLAGLEYDASHHPSLLFFAGCALAARDISLSLQRFDQLYDTRIGSKRAGVREEPSG